MDDSKMEHRITESNHAFVGGLDRPVKQGSGVHPGWYSMPVSDFETTQEQDDTARFTAFMQLLRTVGALDRV